MSYENTDPKIMNKIKNIDNWKEKKLQPKKIELLECEKDISEIDNKLRLSDDLPDTSSGSNTPREPTGNLIMETYNPVSDENFAFFSGNLINKNELPEVNYFLCNEEYIKEKNPEGNNYKKKSKNFILKSKYNFNTINIEDIDYNKINNILKDIENIENKENYTNNQSNIYIDTDINITNNQNKLTYKETQCLNFDSNSVFPNTNMKFDCK